MRRTLWIAPILLGLSVSACDGEHKLMPNTEEYFKAHGIIQGQPNELRIGGTLFRFPAGVGLNPYTAVGIPVVANGGDGIPLERTPHKIVKGQADKVTLHLDVDHAFAPVPDSFASGQAIRIEISKWGGGHDPHGFDKAIQDKPVVVNYPKLGLKEYKSEKVWISSLYESTLQKFKSVDGGKLTFGCQPSQGQTSGLCRTGYWRADGEYSVSIVMQKQIFLERWQEVYLATVHFIDSVVAK